jgi:Helix-turn-helix domain
MTTGNEAGRNPGKGATQKTTDAKHTGNSADHQRARLLQALEERPMTTLDIRRDLDILGVAPRVFELRHKHGKHITTTWADEPTDGGRLHRVARYTLHPVRDLFSDLSEPADAQPTH